MAATVAMPRDTWPVVDASEEAWAKTLANERVWIANETIDLLRDVRHGLNDCYALLAPVDPGSTLVVSTQRAEKVKGTITRVGTRIVKGTLHVQLKTQPPVTLTISPANPIPIAPLATIHAHLTQCTDLASLILSPSTTTSAAPVHTPEYLFDQLRIISHALAESIALLAGPRKPTPVHRPATALAPPSDSSSRPATAHSHISHHHSAHPPPPHPLPQPFFSSASTEWTTSSLAAVHFSPPLPPWLSTHIYISESFITLGLRALEPADAPVNLGTKLGLAIGTVRRLEHDEMDRVFRYAPESSLSSDVGGLGQQHQQQRRGSSSSGMDPSSGTDVYVREKVEVDSADPCLMSLAAKLTSLSHTLAQARRNLACVLDVEFEE